MTFSFSTVPIFPNYTFERQVWYTIRTGLDHIKLEKYPEKLELNNQGVITILRFWRFMTSWRSFLKEIDVIQAVN